MAWAVGGALYYYIMKFAALNPKYVSLASRFDLDDGLIGVSDWSE